MWCVARVTCLVLIIVNNSEQDYFKVLCAKFLLSPPCYMLKLLLMCFSFINLSHSCHFREECMMLCSWGLWNMPQSGDWKPEHSWEYSCEFSQPSFMLSAVSKYLDIVCYRAIIYLSVYKIFMLNWNRWTYMCNWCLDCRTNCHIVCLVNRWQI